MIKPTFKTSLSLSDAIIDAANRIHDYAHNPDALFTDKKEVAFEDLYQAMLQDKELSEILLSSHTSASDLSTISLAMECALFYSNEVDDPTISLLLFPPSLKHLVNFKEEMYKEVVPDNIPDDFDPWDELPHNDDAVREIRHALELLEATYSDEQNARKVSTGADHWADDFEISEEMARGLEEQDRKFREFVKTLPPMKFED